MLEVSFSKQSNRADWEGSFYLWDGDVGPTEYIDLTDCIVTMTVAYEDGGEVLTASSEDETITFPQDGSFAWSFSASQMGSLQPGTYAVGIRITKDVGDVDKVVQFLIGTLPIVEGVDR